MTDKNKPTTSRREADIELPPEASLAERICAIGRDCARRLGAEYRSLDHDALLYDKDGLPH